MSNLNLKCTAYLGVGKTDNHPERQELTIQQIYDLLGKPRISEQKDGGYILTVLLGESGVRNEKNVEAVGGFFLDFDKGVDEFTIKKKLRGVEFFAHTTFSHTADFPRWRVFIPYNKEYPVSVHKNVYFYMVNLFHGYEIDNRCKTASQLWYLPTAKSKKNYRTIQMVGELFNPSTLRIDSEKQTQDRWEPVVSIGLWVPAGSRDQWFFEEAIKYRTYGLVYEETLAALEQVRLYYTEQPPGDEFTRAELRQKVDSAYRYDMPSADEALNDRMVGNEANEPEEIEEEEEAFRLISMSDLVNEKTEWLWKNRIARGFLHMVAGDPGIGKSLFLMHIAALISKGGRWPCKEGKAAKGLVLYITAEDHLKKTVRPRLTAAKANMRNIVALDDNSVEGFDLQLGIEFLRKEIAARKIKAVFIDPVTAFLGDADSYKDADLRRVLKPLSDLAEECDVAIIGLSHLNKSQGQKALQRIGGSIAFGAAPRIVHLLSEDPDDSEMRLVITAKSNIGERLDAITYITNKTFVGEEKIETVELMFGDKLKQISAHEAINCAAAEGGNKKEEAEMFLKEHLKNHCAPAKQIQSEAKLAGITYDTLRRASESLDILKFKGEEKDAPWYWDLPDEVVERNPKSMRARARAQSKKT